jgi:hypothetical protein
MVRQYSSPPRSTMTPAMSANGRASASALAPWNTLARSQPSNARRAMPIAAETSAMATAPAMRQRWPSVKIHSRLSKYMPRTISAATV